MGLAGRPGSQPLLVRASREEPARGPAQWPPGSPGRGPRPHAGSSRRPAPAHARGPGAAGLASSSTRFSGAGSRRPTGLLGCEVETRRAIRLCPLSRTTVWPPEPGTQTSQLGFRGSWYLATVGLGRARNVMEVSGRRPAGASWRAVWKLRSSEGGEKQRAEKGGGERTREPGRVPA